MLNKLDIYVVITTDILITRFSNVFKKETNYQKLLQGVRCNDLAFDVFQIQEKLLALAGIFMIPCVNTTFPGDMINQFS